MANHTHTERWEDLKAHIMSCPRLASQLMTLHDLALYDSGDARLSTEEKEALLNCKTLSAHIARLQVPSLPVRQG